MNLSKGGQKGGDIDIDKEIESLRPGDNHWLREIHKLLNEYRNLDKNVNVTTVYESFQKIDPYLKLEAKSGKITEVEQLKGEMKDIASILNKQNNTSNDFVKRLNKSKEVDSLGRVLMDRKIYKLWKDHLKKRASLVKEMKNVVDKYKNDRKDLKKKLEFVEKFPKIHKQVEILHHIYALLHYEDQINTKKSRMKFYRGELSALLKKEVTNQYTHISGRFTASQAYYYQNFDDNSTYVKNNEKINEQAKKWDALMAKIYIEPFLDKARERSVQMLDHSSINMEVFNLLDNAYSNSDTLLNKGKKRGVSTLVDTGVGTDSSIGDGTSEPTFKGLITSAVANTGNYIGKRFFNFKSIEDVEKERLEKKLGEENRQLREAENYANRANLRIDKVKFGKLIDMIKNIHNKNSNYPDKAPDNSKNRKMGIYKDIAEEYIKLICANNADCKMSEDAENSKDQQTIERKKKIAEIIDQLEDPKFVSYIQSQDQLAGVKYKRNNPGKKIYLKQDETRRIVVEILRKYNSDNFVDLDHVLYRLFPRTFDINIQGLGPVPDRIKKKTEYKLRGYRSELEEDETNQKFGRLVPELNISYPNGFMEEMLSSFLDVENFMVANSKQGDKSRDKSIDTPILNEGIVATEQQFYPDANPDKEPATSSNKEEADKHTKIEKNPQ